MRPGARGARTIAQEIIAHLSAQLGANVTVSLEIEANLKDPAPDTLVRTITENCRTLNFDDSDFEET